MSETGHFATRFMKSVTPEPGDPTFSILKTHLLIEELLRTYLERQCAHPTVMRNAKLTYAQILQIARAFCPNVDEDYWVWKAMGDLNKLRNELAHKLEPAEFDKKVETYSEFIVAQSGIPLPPFLNEEQRAAILADPRVKDHHFVARYFKVDMANIGLYSIVLGVLGFPKDEGMPVK